MKAPQMSPSEDADQHISVMSQSARFGRRPFVLLGATAIPVALGLIKPQLAEATTTKLCVSYSGCAAKGYGDAGYAAASSTSYWGMYPGHNCTNYAAYRLTQDRVDASYLTGQGNAYQWGPVARSHGVAVDGSPRVGDIAWWDGNAGLGSDGHVAYVESVGADYVIVSQDAYRGDFSWAKCVRDGVEYPTAFIHFGGPRDLFFIKTKNTNSGKVEVHTATAASGYNGSDLHATSWFGSGDKDNGWFQMVGRDLFFIKTKNTNSGKVEVHTATAASGYNGSDLHATSWFGSGDKDNGWFQMVGRDLFFIKTKNTNSGKVEVHTATAASGYNGSDLHATSWFGSGDKDNGWFQMVGRDLFFIKTKNTNSGKVEVHTATAASGYNGSDLHATSWFGSGDKDNGWFQMVGRDLFFIKTKNTNSGKVEVHTATAASGYNGSDLHATSWFGSGDKDNGWFQMLGAKR